MMTVVVVSAVVLMFMFYYVCMYVLYYSISKMYVRLAESETKKKKTFCVEKFKDKKREFKRNSQEGKRIKCSTTFFLSHLAGRGRWLLF